MTVTRADMKCLKCGRPSFSPLCIGCQNYTPRTETRDLSWFLWRLLIVTVVGLVLGRMTYVARRTHEVAEALRQSRESLPDDVYVAWSRQVEIGSYQ